MRIVELTRSSWPSLAELFSANKTVGGCWCAWYLRTAREVDGGWSAGNTYPRLAKSKVAAAVDYAREHGARAVEAYPVDIEELR